MQKTCVGCIVVYVILADIKLTFAAGPTWTSPSSTTITIDSTTSGVCDDVTTLIASSTDGSTVAYGISSQTPDGGFNFVQNPATFINHLTCTVGSINVESYTVVVSARHDGGNNEETSLTLTIIFSNLAEKSPVFVLPDPDSTKPEHTIYIDETIQAGDVVLQLSATDEDTDDATLTFNMVASDVNTKALFEIVGAALKVKSSVTQDYFDIDENGAVQQYPIDLEVSDGGTSTTLSTFVVVRDINDNAPEFSGETSVTIQETATGGQNVLKLTVNDKDKTSDNNQVTLTLLEGSEKFGLSGNDLNVAVGATFNYEDTSSYSVVVNANDNAPNNPQETNQTITININAMPVFVDPDPDTNSEDHNIYICETIQKGDEVMTFQASDGNTDTASLVFSMDQSDAATLALFEVVGDKLKVKSDVADDYFDIENENAVIEYDIVLVVSDGELSSTLTVKIFVEDDNDNAPIFSGAFTANLLESSPAGHIVLDLTATDNDQTEENNQVTFSLAGATEFEIGGDNMSSIEVASGAVFDVKTTSLYTLTVTASDNVPDDAQTTTQEINVTIVTQPVFNKINTPQTASVDENVADTVEIYTFDATDKDGDSLTITISQQPTPEVFMVEGQTLKPKSGVTLDADGGTNSYELRFNVSDGVFEIESDVLTVTVNDLNDNAPEFTENDPVVELDELAPDGFVVYDVNATDADVGNPNNVMKFSMTETDTSDFTIATDSGIISVGNGANLNFTAKSEYILEVVAKDGNDPTDQSATTNVTIILKTTPVFVSPDPDKSSENHNIYICETIQANGEVMTLIASDGDTDASSLTFSMGESNAVTSSLFEIVGNKLNVKGNVAVDYFDVDKENAVKEFEIVLQVSDGEFSSSLTTKIFVEDDNDNAPIFSGNFTANLLESSPAGTVVLALTATDDDITEDNNQVTFSLSGATEFEIGGEDMSSIVVASQAVFDVKTTSLYTLTVTASDNVPDDAQTTTQDINVTIVTQPVFNKLNTPQTASVDENAADTVDIYAFDATDKDGDSLTITISQQPTPEMFRIDGHTLKPKTGVTFDADEGTTSYQLKFMVSDGMFETESDELTVTVKELNDNSPQFTAINPTVKISEKAKSGDHVFMVSATDADIGNPNNDMIFSMTETDTNDFTIDQNSGNITVNAGASLDFNSKSEYSLVVTAKDGNDPADNSAENTVTVKLITEPMFDNLAVARSTNIDENSDANTQLFEVSVTDADATWDNTVTILSQTPAEIFEMDGSILKTMTNGLDAETQTEYKLKFRVTDGDFVVDSAELTINVLDLNDNTPVISSVNPVTIPENKDIGTEVVDIQATDNDVTSANNVLSYSITSGNDDSIFAIDASTGSISLEQTLSMQSYSLKIEVSDSGDPARSATVDVTIYVDANEIDECSTNPCENGATCSSAVNVYECTCIPGFTGNNCETNIDDCDPNPCLIEGTCIDGINTYNCNCTEGWTGQTCSEACTNNTYGRDCLNQCNCNASRVLLDAETQQCEIKTGICKCNSKYINDGSTCEDKNECETSNICGDSANVVCENTIGSHYCTCQQGYTNSSNGCIESNVPVNVEINPGEVAVKIKLKIISDCPDLTKPSVYLTTKTKLEKSVKKSLPSNKRVYITLIFCASLDFESIIVTDKADTANLANEISNITEAIEYNGQNVDVGNLQVNDSTVNKSKTEEQRACEAFTFIEQCTGDYECLYENGMPSCKKIKEDNLALILGLALGVCLPLCLMAIIAGVYLCRQLFGKKIHEKGHRRHHNGSSMNNKESPWRGRMKQNGFKIDTRNYDRQRFYEDSKHVSPFSGNPHYYDMPGLGYTSI